MHFKPFTLTENPVLKLPLQISSAFSALLQPLPFHMHFSGPQKINRIPCYSLGNGIISSPKPWNITASKACGDLGIIHTIPTCTVGYMGFSYPPRSFFNLLMKSLTQEIYCRERSGTTFTFGIWKWKEEKYLKYSTSYTEEFSIAMGKAMRVL